MPYALNRIPSTIRYDTRCYFNVRSKANTSQLNLPHGTTHTRLTALFPELPCTRKVKPIWILLTQETVSGSGISWAVCKSAPRSRQIATPALHHSVFYRPDDLPECRLVELSSISFTLQVTSGCSSTSVRRRWWLGSSPGGVVTRDAVSG